MTRSTVFLVYASTGSRFQTWLDWVALRHPNIREISRAMLGQLEDLQQAAGQTFAVGQALEDQEALSVAERFRAQGHRVVVFACSPASAEVPRGDSSSPGISPAPRWGADTVTTLVRRADQALVLPDNDVSPDPRRAYLRMSGGTVISLAGSIPTAVQDQFDREIAEFLTLREGAVEESFERARHIVKSLGPGLALRTAHSGRYVGPIVAITALHVIQRIDYADGWFSRGDAAYVAHVKLKIPQSLNVGDYFVITHDRRGHTTRVTTQRSQFLGPMEINDPLVTISLHTDFARSVRAFVAELSRAVALPGANPNLPARLLKALIVGADRCMQEQCDVMEQRRSLAHWVARELGRLGLCGSESPFLDRTLNRVYRGVLSSSQRRPSVEARETPRRHAVDGAGRTELAQPRLHPEHRQ